MRPYSTAVIGGGASGIAAAISAKRAGRSCILLEKTPRLGKKILASGNGRCNLLNENLDARFYNPASWPLVKSIFAKFGKKEILDFFKSLGLYMEQDECGRYFPATNQSASVLKALEMELKRLSIPVELDYDVTDITCSKDGFITTSGSGKKISSDSAVLTGGGKSYPSFGSDGNIYRLAERFGHKIVKPVPVCVPLVVKDPILQGLQGQRISVKAKAMVEREGSDCVEGDLLFTKYGLSGAAILDLSEDISIAVNREGRKDVSVSVDMVPRLDERDLAEAIGDRLNRKFSDEEILVGILPNKFGPAMKYSLKTKDAEAIAGKLKNWIFKITGTRGWNEAEFTAGGIDTREVKEGTLESRLKQGLYFAGECLDVNGKRGGYNLAWAWASGYVAGQNAI